MASFSTFSSPTNRISSLYSLKPSNYPFNCATFFHNHRIRFLNSSINCKRNSFRSCCSSSSSLKDRNNSDTNRTDSTVDVWTDSHFVEVIGIGSRVDSVLDFCLSSPSTSHPLRFWNVVRGEQSRGLLRQRVINKDAYPNIVKAPLDQHLHLKAVVLEDDFPLLLFFILNNHNLITKKPDTTLPRHIPTHQICLYRRIYIDGREYGLVASAGYGEDYVTATDILRAIRSSGGLVVAVIVKPFSFEGQRRRDEVNMLVDTLRDCVNFYIDIDIDSLLKMDLVTLDEALKTAYQAVFSAISAVPILVSDAYKKQIHSLHGSVTKSTIVKVIEVLESYKEGRVGFGIGYNIKASIVKAVYDCPFLSIGLKDLDGVVVCILSSSSAIGDTDVSAVVQTFREATGCSQKIIFSVVHNPDMKPNLIETTVITVCVSERKSVQNSSIFSRLADSIPLVFNLFRRHDMQSGNPEKSNRKENVFPPMVVNFMNEMLLDENGGQKDIEDGETDKTGYLDSSKYIEQNAQAQTFERKVHINRNIRPGYSISQDLHEEELNAGSDPLADNPRIFQLPVGVRLSDDSQDNCDKSNFSRATAKINDEDVQVQSSATPSVTPLDGLTDMGFDAVSGFWNSASVLLKGKQPNISKKQGVLSARAASMLESERDNKTRWSPVMEIRYRGGVYKGRCQGGLPEGRGRLTFLDGTVYDGMWRYGKRSGIGSLFFSNGDVFHGLWRDDLMHGKGWLYFYTGERWFANFWKGRANGEGRFYSKSGEVFFGHFQDGWRHGEFLCVKVDGTRFVEIWDEGVLKSSEELET
ncbi:Protein ACCUMULATION AND REPLICATION OF CHLOROPLASTS 3 [Bienertia sinuspersici]